MERSEHANSSSTAAPDTGSNYSVPYILGNSHGSISAPLPLLWFPKAHTYTRFLVLIDIRGVDYPSRTRRFAVVYNSTSTRYSPRICVQTCVDEITRISPVVRPFPSACWWEREVWDMFGVYSINHPDLRRILTDYGFDGHPLRKDSPISGYVEVRYDDPDKRVVSAEPIEITQEFRYFEFASPWEQ
uniref:NADH dehydrogenase subunit 9 n=1 Tax=Ephedra przewalskii TaxID=257425 RepID=A0A8F4MFQ5_9SPER|nr:NADH dehydrogenase subunit 9 [Ephedra przewalskii]